MVVVSVCKDAPDTRTGEDTPLDFLYRYSACDIIYPLRSNDVKKGESKTKQ